MDTWYYLLRQSIRDPHTPIGKTIMPLSRRKILQSASLLSVIAAVPCVVRAQVEPLSVGVNRNIVASIQHVGAPQNVDLSMALAYLYTHGAAGVFIDIVPEPKNGGHAGICFNAAPNANFEWQTLTSSSGAIQELWYRGVGVIFQEDGQIQSEQWVVGPDGKSQPANVATIGYYPKNTVLRVTGTTDISNGKTEIAVYSLNNLGAVVALLGSVTLNVEYIGDRAGVFVIDEQVGTSSPGNIQVQPFAIYH